MIARAARRARLFVNASRAAADLRWRQVPRFATGSTRTRRPMLHYLAPHLDAPSGGVRNIYRHVDTLNDAGINAVVVHARAGFRATWFDNRTRVADAADVIVEPDDVLVIPECFGPGLPGLPADRRIVLLNQAAYHTFDRIPFDTTVAGAPYATVAGLVAILAVSQDNADLLRYAFPAVPVHVARPVVDGSIFHPDDRARPRRIAYVASRRADELEQLRHLLRAGGLLDRWELVPIRGRTDRQTAEIMRDAPIFLSLSEREGFGLPPAEAMASGCYVVGYTGLGGREFFDPAYSSPVPEGDLAALVHTIHRTATTYEREPDRLTALGRIAAERVVGHYAPARLRDDLLNFYRPLVNTTGVYAT